MKASLKTCLPWLLVSAAVLPLNACQILPVR